MRRVFADVVSLNTCIDWRDTVKTTSKTVVAAFIALGVVLIGADTVICQRALPSAAGRLLETRVGILLLAHGGSPAWNNEVLKLAAEVNKDVLVEVAFGMATKRTMQEGIDKLVARGAQQIVAVPLFISSYSSVITSTEYLLGIRKEAPADLASFAKMDHSEMNHDNHAMMNMNAQFNPLTPVVSPVPLRMMSALNRHPLVAEILLDRARAISQNAAREVVILVAHGPAPDDDNVRWLDDMSALASLMKGQSSYKRIEYVTLRDDASNPVRAQATADLRKLVERAVTDGDRVLIVPLLLSYGGIETGLKKRLEGLNYAIGTQALLPDERLVRWTLQMAR